jgi:hypothetical protein
VNDLFGADAALVQEKETRDGGMLQAGVARRNVNGREPRLLPFPPGMSSFSAVILFIYLFSAYPQRHIISRKIHKAMGWGC